MDNERMIVSNAGPLIHLTKIGRLNLLKELFKIVIIPRTVKMEVVDKGKEKGAPDAFLIENEVGKWIAVEGDINDKVKEIAKRAGIEIGEAIVIMLAKEKGCSALIDDSAARRFAIGLGLEVIGSIGVLIKVAKVGIITKEEALEGLEKITKVMWLSVDVYEDARKNIEGLK
jgi:predicted nucleic acid-binding protein